MKALTSSLKSYGLPDFLQELRTVVIALLNPDGEVLAANQGFLNIARLQAPPEDGWNAASLFLNPPLQALAKMLPDAEDSVIFRGILTLGREDTIGHSLQGSVYRWQHCLLIIAEHDTDGLEQLTNSVLALNDELATMQRKLVRANRELECKQATIERLMNTDPLTGIANRRRFDEAMTAEIRRNRRFGRPLSLIMADIDHFKRVNDTYGHTAGDEALKRFAQEIGLQTRTTDLAARYGGEEFAILLPETRLEESAVCAERIRSAFRAKIVPPLDYATTASFGVAMLEPNEEAGSLIRRADDALYEAKRAGRDRVACARKDSKVI